MKVYNNVFYIGLSMDVYENYNNSTRILSGAHSNLFSNEIFYIPTSSTALSGSSQNISSNPSYLINLFETSLIGFKHAKKASQTVNNFDKIISALPLAEYINVPDNYTAAKIYDPQNPDNYIVTKSGGTFDMFIEGSFIGSYDVSITPNVFVPLTGPNSGGIYATNYNLETGTISAVRFFNVWYFNNILWTNGSGTSARLLRWLNSISEYKPSDTDPFKPGGNTETGGGTGNFDGTSDPIAIPNLPTLSAVDAGFITLFNPTLLQLNNLASYLWNGNFDLNQLRKLFANPMDAILGLSIVPVNVPSGNAREVNVGNIPTGITMDIATTQYVAVDCGTLNVNEYWGAYLDYDPYTKAEIYLPYIGTHAIAVDDIMNKAVQVVYHIDILSGACIAYVKCGDSVLYSFSGQCAAVIPITSSDWSTVINAGLQIAASIGMLAATGGKSAVSSASTILSTAANSMKPNIEKSGAISGVSGMLGIQTPYLILTRPRQALPANQNKYTGYPSFITEDTSQLVGYTEIEYIHLENLPATDDEIRELEEILRNGVIF